ncbi:MAG: trimeric intracellular cation channel family protein [Devosia sp.]|nr:trimeric intracellular cation channel family protein [Devosia sp.]
MLDVIFYIAITAEAMTAALAAGRRKMDWFGVCLLASVTALGGGTTRDLFLGHYPLYWVANPYILLLVCGAALFTIAIARIVHRLKWTFLVLDGLGLVVFTIIGCNVAMEIGAHPLIVIVSGMVTGIVGGILRDVLCNDVPLVFRSELYATVSIVTAMIYYFGVTANLDPDLVILAALAIGFPLRILALVKKWQMPKFVYDKEL